MLYVAVLITAVVLAAAGLLVLRACLIERRERIRRHRQQHIARKVVDFTVGANPFMPPVVSSFDMPDGFDDEIEEEKSKE